ncbi:hypothetical protein HDU83_004624 [Entophlyctis luteolus]|nr:hypothetical protein HDU83_004624 [Entophlyctis luteolus]
MLHLVEYLPTFLKAVASGADCQTLNDCVRKFSDWLVGKLVERLNKEVLYVIAKHIVWSLPGAAFWTFMPRRPQTLPTTNAKNCLESFIEEFMWLCVGFDVPTLTTVQRRVKFMHGASMLRAEEALLGTAHLTIETQLSIAVPDKWCPRYALDHLFLPKPFKVSREQEVPVEAASVQSGIPASYFQSF